MTVRELWSSLDMAGRRDYLLAAGVQLSAVRGQFMEPISPEPYEVEGGGLPEI